MGVGGIDVAFPQVGRLHHVEIAVTDDVVPQAHGMPPPVLRGVSPVTIRFAVSTSSALAA